MKRLRLIGIAIAILLLGWLVLNLTRTREPEYQDRTLTEWLKIDLGDRTKGAHNIDTAPLEVDAEKAIRHMGTNAFPTLLELLQAKDSKFKAGVNSVLNKQSFIGFRFPDSLDQKVMGVTGFRILGKDALPAAPALIKLTSQSDIETRTFALISLESIRPAKETFLPVLIQLLNNPRKSARDPEPSLGWRAADILNNLYPEEAEKAGVYKKFPELKPLKASSGNNDVQSTSPSPKK